MSIQFPPPIASQLVAILAAACLPVVSLGRLTLAPIWTHEAGAKERAEIVAYEGTSQQLLVVNSAERCVMRLDVRTGHEIGRLDVSSYGNPTSVATNGTLIAVAVVAPVKTDPGHVVLFDVENSAEARAAIVVGSLPDMVTFTPDRRYLLTANEGEPNDDYSIDPPGSISIIDVSRGATGATVRTADFARFDSMQKELTAQGVRLGAPHRESCDEVGVVARHLEPEFIAVSPDSRVAWVTLQENNALAIVDIASAQVLRVVSLGLKDHNVAGAGLDASDRDGNRDGAASGGGEARIRPWPLLGMYQPDGIATYQVNGCVYLVTANEGDTRSYTTFEDEARISKLELDEALLRDETNLRSDEALGRMAVSRIDGDTDGDGDLDRLLSFGARSLAIWTENGKLVSDSGDSLERYIAEHLPDRHNINHNGRGKIDARSPKKGPEPEGVVVGRVGDSVYAFVGLERTSAIAIFDITEPCSMSLLDVVPLTATFPEDDASRRIEHLAPEGLAFIPVDQSFCDDALLVVACEGTGTTVLYRVSDSK